MDNINRNMDCSQFAGQAITNTALMLGATAIAMGGWLACEAVTDYGQCPKMMTLSFNLYIGTFAAPVITTGCFLLQKVVPLTDEIYKLGFALPFFYAMAD